jgi:predicted RNA binding protein YcfA (HicA-like mRNA interferase family)
MAKLKPVTFSDFVRTLRKFGFEGPYGGGKHLYMIKDGYRLTIPNPHREIIGIDLLMKILKLADITRDKWMEKL